MEGGSYVPDTRSRKPRVAFCETGAIAVAAASLQLTTRELYTLYFQRYIQLGLKQLENHQKFKMLLASYKMERIATRLARTHFAYSKKKTDHLSSRVTE